ncbi:hypothetical protein [Paenibacillus sacheonensis]|uniref:Uncharacterized protein n=1 Tax=Paenibacillus sacheonensis TaxID=742054 RepID=A0A7X4YLN6_9BACL|nr:hypothetical protein [Paenibacillus sacheonensis]MBM7566053.1 hypothetical protein [Paenibacillus sacheonensis]NBC68638.1 hypothetical protein [Paenibacillus sacheonensis]
MTAIALILLVFMACLTLIMVASIWYMRLMLDKIFGEKHRDLEHIASTGMIPERWSLKHAKKMIRLYEKGDDRALRSARRAAARSYLRKLRRLSAYVKKTNLVENEETRQSMLRNLRQAAREWSEEVQNGSIAAGA